MILRQNYLSREAWSLSAWTWRIGCLITWPRDVARGTWKLILGDPKFGRPYRDYLVAYWVPRPLLGCIGRIEGLAQRGRRVNELLATLPAEAQELLKGEQIIHTRAGCEGQGGEALLAWARAKYSWQHHEGIRTQRCSVTEQACWHLIALWNAKSAYVLAALGAPENASTCECSGTGIFYGVFGTGECFRCRGKGWQSPADVKRNRYYDNRIRRIHA